MGVRVSRPLCRDPHVLLDADAELDLDFIVVVDLDPLHQPGNDHVLGLRVGLVEGVRPGQQVGHFLGGSLSGILFRFFNKKVGALPEAKSHDHLFGCDLAVLPGNPSDLGSRSSRPASR